MKFGRQILGLIIVAMLFCASQVCAASGSSYSSTKVGSVGVKYVTIDMNDKNIQPVVLNAQNQMCATDSLANMAKTAGAFAAINGTYFEAYNGIPVPWGTIIKDGKVLHISQSGAVAGITSSGKLLVDRLSFEFEGYINGEYRAIPWRINHPSPENDAITIFTPEYGVMVDLASGAKGVVVNNGKVTSIATSGFYVPANGFAIVYNQDTAYLVDERYEIGDEVYYKVIIKPTFTNSNDWDDVVSAIGAGPSLIINGQETANGEAEGFFEAKINTNSAPRSFIGGTVDGKIIIGNMASATLKQAAAACRDMGLVNAMCLDGGYSVALYYLPSGVAMGGRNINNGLAFIGTPNNNIIYATPTASSLQVDGINISMEAYNINGSNYFKLRDLALALNGSAKQFDVSWNSAKNAINLTTQQAYSVSGEELKKSSSIQNKTATPTTSTLFINDNQAKFTAYNINGSNYFKLREIGQAIDFGISWDQSSNTIIIDTASSYVP